MNIGVLYVFAGLMNSKVSLASSKASSDDIAVFYFSDFTDSIVSAIDPGYASIIIAQLISSLFYFLVSTFTQLALSLLFQDSSLGCNTAPRLLSGFHNFVFCATACFSAVAISSCSCPDSDSLLFSSSGTDDGVGLRISFF